LIAKHHTEHDSAASGRALRICGDLGGWQRQHAALAVALIYPWR